MNCENANGVNIDCDFIGDAIDIIKVQTFFYFYNYSVITWLSTRISI